MLQQLNSLKLKLLFVLIPGTVLAVSFALLITLIRAEEHFTEKLEQKKDHLSDYATLMSEPLWNFNMVRVESILKAMRQDPDLYSVAVYDEGKNIVAAFKNDTDPTQDLIQINFPLVYKNAHITQLAGTVEILLGDLSLRKEKEQFISSTLISLSLILLVLLAGVWISFSKLLDKPIKALIYAIQNSHGESNLVKVENDSNDELGLISAAFNDMQDRLTRHNERLNQSKEHLQTLYHSTPALLFSLDANGCIQNASDYFLERLGYAELEIVDQHLSILVDSPDSRATIDAVMKQLWQTRLLDEFPLIIKNAKGESLEVLLDATLPIKEPTLNALAVMTDVTSLNQARRKLEHQANTDHLSGMANRYHFQNYLEKLMLDRRSNGAEFALLFIDLDHFKSVNDTFGHHIGDQLICQAAERINSTVRPEDSVARLGGDEFAVILEHLEQPETAEQITERILKQLNRPFRLAESNIFVSSSVGIALYPKDSNSPAKLLQCADMAMYRAKEEGRGCFSFYSAEHTQVAQQRHYIEALLRRAENDQLLEIHYQPIICLQGDKIVGFEALLRLKDDQKGTLISPSEFIPVAEETGLIISIGEWCLLEAFQQLSKWHESFDPNLYMSINVSSRQFQSLSFLSSIEEAIAIAEIKADSILIEITESLLLHDNQSNLDICRNLQSLGCQIAIDDFGTGFSALSYLMKFPLNVLKIDRSFISQLSTEENHGLVTAIIQMAHSMNLKIIAEGLETQEQLDKLRAISDQISVQGFLFAKPQPKHKIGNR